MSRNPVYVSTAGIACHYGTLSDLLVAVTGAGIRRIELGWAPPLGGLVLPDALAGFQAHWLLHNYFPAPAESFVINLASQNPLVLQRSLDFCTRAIALSAALGAPFYSVHCGFLAEFESRSLGRELKYSEVWDYESGYATFLSSIQILLRAAKVADIRLLVEPNVVAPFNLIAGHNRLLMLAEPREFSRLLGDLTDERFGILLDLGHLKVTASTLGFDVADFIAVVAPAVGAFHLHDNNGSEDQHLPVGPDSWMLEVIRDSHFVGLPVTNEAKFPNAAEMVEHCIWLEKFLTR